MSYNGKRKKNVEKFSDSTVSKESQYIKNTNLFLRNSIRILPIFIYFYLNGKSNVDKELLNKKNLIVLAVNAAFFCMVSYNVGFENVKGWIGSLIPVDYPIKDHAENDYSASSDILYQTMFSSIATFVALRTVNNNKADFKDIVLIILTIYTTFIYSVGLSWTWGGGYLAEAGFADFSGSMICWGGPAVMSLMFTIIFPMYGDVKLLDKFEYKSDFMSSILLIIGFLGINNGSQLAFGTQQDATEVSTIMLNTLNFAFGSILAGVFTGNYTPLPGLISSAAEPLAGTPIMSFSVGFCSSILFHFANLFCVNTLKIPNEKDLGIIASAIFGSLAGLTVNADMQLLQQLKGIVAYIALFTITSFIIFKIVKLIEIPKVA